MGTNRFIVGAANDDAGATDAGCAYLYDLNGVLLATITNPAPADGDRFGRSVAGVGTDRFIVGAHGNDTGATDAGCAYLYDLNGVLLATITNPAPAGGDLFGRSVAGVGTNRFIVGAYLDDAGASSAGSAYLYDLNGALLVTITNPAPAVGDLFGNSVAGVGTNRFIVGAYNDDAGATDSGSAYLYDLNGILLAAITNPTPAAVDYFGRSVAGVGMHRFIVGVNLDDAGAENAGGAYLYSINSYPLVPGLTAESTGPNSIGLTQLDTASVDNRYVLKTGDTMSGPLNLPAGGLAVGTTQLVASANGNVGIGTSSPTGLLHVAGNAYATAWLTTSDRNAKQDIAPVDAAAILEKISALPVATWSFKTEPDVKHIGPMAQDFRAAFGLSPNDTSIATVDADGVALAAIQALKKENDELKKQLDAVMQRQRELETSLRAVLQQR